MKDRIDGDGNNLANRDINIYNNTSNHEDYGVINTIFDYVLQNISEDKSEKNSSYSRDKIIRLNKKIKLNFSDNIEQEEVKLYFTKLFEKISFVERGFASLDNEDQSDIHIYILKNYKELRREGLDPIQILSKLCEIFIPTKFKKNPNYNSIAQAIVLFFFDDCTIFEKTDEEPKEKDLFSDL